MPERTDDEDLGNDEILLRRVLDRPNEWFTQADDGTVITSSAAFKDSTLEVSVNVASQTNQTKILGEFSNDGLVSLLAGVPRSLDHIVSKTLEPNDPDDPSHRVICPPPERGKKHRLRDAKTMAISSTFLILPKSVRKES